MGRKIPGKKHRNIKDPYKQRRKRLESLRLKVNNPPFNSDDQEIPKSLLKIMELKKKAKQLEKSSSRKQHLLDEKKRKRKLKKAVVLSFANFLDKEPTVNGMSKPDIFIPNLIQKPNESTKSFLGRVGSMTQNLLNEVEFEKKFGVEIKKNFETGEVMEVKNIKSKRKKKKLAEKRKAKLNQKRDNLKNLKDFDQLKDNIEFGEVVHSPPEMAKVKEVKHKIQKSKFSNLLLNKIVENSQTKTKNLESNLEKERKENERKFIAEAYRKLKKIE